MNCMSFTIIVESSLMLSSGLWVSMVKLLAKITSLSVSSGITHRMQCKLPNIIGMFSADVLCMTGNTISEIVTKTFYKNYLLTSLLKHINNCQGPGSQLLKPRWYQHDWLNVCGCRIMGSERKRYHWVNSAINHGVSSCHNIKV